MTPPLAQLDELPPPPRTDPGEQPAPAPVQMAALDDLPDPSGEFVAQAPVSFWNRPITAIAQGIGNLFVDKPEGLQVSPQGVELMAHQQHMPREIAAELLRASGAQPDTGSQIYAPAQAGLLPRMPMDPRAQEALWQAAAAEGRTGETAAREADRLEPFPAALRPLIGAGRSAGDAVATAALYGGALAGGGDDTRAVLADQAEQAAARQEGRDRNLGGVGKVAERAGSTILSMLVTPGGQGAKIMQAALTQGGQSYAEAIQAGLSDEEARQYAAKQAIAEAVPAALTSGIGAGGVERVAAQTGRAEGSAAARFGRTMLEEQPEELATTVAQQQLQTQIDPQAMENEQLAKSVIDTIEQTVAAGGFAHLPEAIRSLWDKVQGAPEPAPRLPEGVAPQLSRDDLRKLAASEKEQQGSPREPVAPEVARAANEADLEQGGFKKVPGITPELAAEISRLMGGQQPVEAAGDAAESIQQPSPDTQAPPLSGPGSDPTPKDRAVDSAPAGEIPEAAPSPAPTDPAARIAAERGDLGTGTTLTPEQSVDVKVGRNVHQGTVAAVNEDGSVSVRLQDGRIVPKVPAFRVIPREAPKPEQQQIDTAAPPTTHVDAAAADAHPAPSEAQKEAGNYQKGHVRLHGMDVSIENAKGSERSGTDANGKPWSVEMPAHYGYVRGTEGADGDHVDVYVGPHPETATAYVVDQIDAEKGTFDEHKAMLGFASKAEAVKAYDAAFSDGKGPQRRGAVTAMPIATFKKWSASRAAKKPLRWKEPAHGDPAPQTAADPAPAPSSVPPVAGRVEERSGVAPALPADAAPREAPPAEVPTGVRAETIAPPEEKPQRLKPHRQRASPAVEAASDVTPTPTEDAGITDFGEKIGGARKDTATKTGPKGEKKAQDERPAWSRRYNVAEIVSSSTPGEQGRFSIQDTKDTDWRGQPRQVGRTTFATHEEAESAIPLIAVSRNHKVRSTRDGKHAIVRQVTDRKRVTIKDGFETEADAMRYMAQNAREIIEQKTGFGEEVLAKPDTIGRVGPDRRQGDVVPQDFMEAFGFRGVEFGNWNNQAERQEVMNHAYEGLMDLAEVVGVPAKALSLNGELALAFGARGHGLQGARAHYERDYGVINLTKMKGAGSLAHEWWHGLDHYLGRQDGKAKAERVPNKNGDMTFPAKARESDLVSHGFSYNSKARPELVAAHKQLMATLMRKAEQFVHDTEAAEKFLGDARDRLSHKLDEIRSTISRSRDYGLRKAAATTEQLARFDGLAQQLQEGDQSSATVDGISDLMKEVTGRQGFNSEGTGPINYLRRLVTNYGARAKLLADARAESKQTRQIPTQYARDAMEIDQGRIEDYWSQPHEMVARAFSAYVEDQIKAKGGSSAFLSFGSDNAFYKLFKMRPFPEGEERLAMDRAFDDFFKIVKAEEADDGKVRLFAPDRVPGQSEPAGESEPVEGAEPALEAPERTPGGKDAAGAARPESSDGIEALIRWALAERTKTISEMKRRAARAGDGDTARDYERVAEQYEAVSPEELTAHMRAYPGHYLKAVTTTGGSMDPVQVYRQRADLPPVEPRVTIAPAAAGEAAPDLRTTLKTLAADLRRAAPGAPTLGVDRGALPEGAAGEFDTRSGGITVRYHNDLDLVAHEVGHWAAETYKLLGKATDEAARAELARFGVHGSEGTGELLQREGMAEYLRAWMVNPGEAEARAPAFTALVRREVPPKVLDALATYGASVRAFASAPAVQQVAAGIMATKAAAKDEKSRVRISRLIIDGIKGLFGAGRARAPMRPGVVPKGFNATRADKARFALTDQQAPMLANYVTSLALVGADPTKLKPTQHWDYLRKFSRGEAGRLRDMVLEHGLAGPDLTVAKDAVTGKPMTLSWLLDPITSLGDDWVPILDKAHAYGVAERSLELEERFTTQTENEIGRFTEAKLRDAGNDRFQRERAEREVRAYARAQRETLARKLARLTAAGGGINSASETARRAMSELDQDAHAAGIREYLRRYRAWADFNLDYAVRTELLTPDGAAAIRNANQSYIDWHRVFGEDDGPIDIGQAVEGSARTIHNPLASLLHATWSAVNRGDRNRLMQAFIAPLRMAPAGDPAMQRALSTLGRQISDDEASAAFEKQGGYHDDVSGERRRVYRVQRLVMETNDDGSPIIDQRTNQPLQEIKTENWVFDSGTEASIEAGRVMLSDHPWMLLMQGLNALQRHMITLSPGFRFKVPVRDNIERMMNSEVGSHVRDVPGILAGKTKLEGRPLDELFSLSGASLAGWNQHTRDSALSEVLGHVAELRRSKWTVATPAGFLRAWNRIGEGAENIARKAEFAAAYRKARAQGMEGTDASLYAMTHSRSLLDTAEHGHLIGRLNGIALFLNASIKGLQRTNKMALAALAAYRRGEVATGNRLAATVSLRTVMLGSAFAAARLAFLASLDDDDEQKKALREPAWKRDFALRFNIPGLGKIAIPKPYEWGWLGTGFERLADAAFAAKKGWHEDARRAYEGYGSSFLGAVLPMHEEIAAASFAPVVEVMTNHSFFTNSHLVPVHEEKLDVDLRKGTANASPLGRGLSHLIPADPRNIDHLIRGYFGGFGSIATARNLGELARRFSGYAGETSVYASRDVNFVMDYTDSRGSSGRPDVKLLHAQLKAAANETDQAKRSKLESIAIKQAERIRAAIERSPKAYKGEE